MDAIRTILVTGASSGIGQSIARRLSSSGFFVYAGTRKQSDFESLKSLPNVTPICLDVTNDREILSAVATIQQRGTGLYGLINNAGISTWGGIIDGDEREFDLVMATNVRGLYKVTKAFAKMIAFQRGRIINIGSLSGFLSSRNLSAYSMSKHAVEAFTDSLAAEMVDFGVHVSVIEPSFFRTALIQNSINRTGHNGRHYDLSNARDPDIVADAALAALTDTKPKLRYLVVGSEEEARLPIQTQLRRVAELNLDQPYSLDRSLLISMLESELEETASHKPSR